MDYLSYVNNDDADLFRGAATPSQSENEEDALLAPADPDVADEPAESDGDGDRSEESEDEKAEENTEESEFLYKNTALEYSKEIIIVHPDDRITPTVMSKFEMTEHTSIRATLIAQHNDCMVDIGTIDDPIKQAKLELMMRMSPLILRRYVGDRRNPKTGEMQSYYEDWDPNEMTFSVVYQIY